MPLMHDKDQPPQEEGVAENITEVIEHRLTVVRVDFTPKDPNNETVVSPRRFTFVSSGAAREFIASLEPGKYGSPKQDLAKRAQRMRVPLDVLHTHNYTATIEEDQQNGSARAAARNSPRVGPADQPPVQPRSSGTDFGGLDDNYDPLQEQEAGLSEDGDGEAEDGD